MGDGLVVVALGTGRIAVDVGCGQHHSCAVLDDGSLKCWGHNGNGRLSSYKAATFVFRFAVYLTDFRPSLRVTSRRIDYCRR